MIESHGGKFESQEQRFLRVLESMLREMDPGNKERFKRLILAKFAQPSWQLHKNKQEGIAAGQQSLTKWKFDQNETLEKANKTQERVEWVIAALKEAGVEEGKILRGGRGFQFEYKSYWVQIDISGFYSKGLYFVWFLPISEAIGAEYTNLQIKAARTMNGQPLRIEKSPKTKPEPVKEAIREILEEISKRMSANIV